IQAGKRFEDPLNLRTSGTFDEVRAGGFEARQHLLDNEADGIAGAVLYPTTGLSLHRSIADGRLLDHVCRIYNDWLAEFCGGGDGPVRGAAMVSVDDPDVAVAEMTRARDVGLWGAFLPTGVPAAENYGLPRYEPVWAASQDLDMPLSLHFGSVRYGAMGA